MQLHRLSGIVEVACWRPTGATSAGALPCVRASVDLVLLSKRAHGETSKVVIDETINLGILEKGLRNCDLPDDRPPIISNRGDIAPLMRTIHATLPPADQGAKLRGKV